MQNDKQILQLTDVKLLELYHICVKLKNSIDSIKINTRLFLRFPNGCCRDTTLIAGKFLQDAGFKDIYYCWKELDDYNSHAWLEYKNYIIDLTVNQFGNDLANILITPRPYHSIYHNPFKKQAFNMNIASTDLLDLLFDYKLIKQQYNKDYDDQS